MSRKDYFDQLYSSYTKVSINRELKIVTFEHPNGWYEMAVLDADLAFWILLNKKLEVVYE